MNLSTTYMGLNLRNPLIASASPLSRNADNIKLLEDAGAASVVMFSLFEEQIRHEEEAHDYFTSSGTNSFAEALSYFPKSEEYNFGPDTYLEIIRKASESVDIPIIGSLNGITSEGWIDYAKQIQQAGASGVELNVYYLPVDPYVPGAEIEQRYIEILRSVKSSVSIPVALKLSPFFSAFGNMAKQFDEAGADALVLFNRFYQPDFDLDRMGVSSSLNLSTSGEIRLPLLWIAVLYQRLKASLAATRGVETHLEVAKYILAGADAVMTTSALLRNGIDYMKTLVDGLTQWMQDKGYESVEQMKGAMSQRNVAEPEAYERANYIKILEEYKSRFVL